MARAPRAFELPASGRVCRALGEEALTARADGTTGRVSAREPAVAVSVQ